MVSALLSRRGAPAELLRRWLAGSFELVVSDALLAELERALAYQKLSPRILGPEASRFVDGLRRSAQLVSDQAGPPRRSADPDDDYLLALAENAAAVLVTGDRHLLDLRGRLPIRSAREYLQSLDQSSEC